MDVTPMITSDRMVVQSYGPAGFKISGQVYAGNVIVFPDRVLAWSGDMQDLLGHKSELDVVLYGSGKIVRQLPREEKLAYKTQGLHIDTMDTGAACRTYNVLMAEGRRVAAALLKPV